MGEAARRREILRATMLALGTKWDFPPSEWEAALCAELKENEVMRVPRASAAQLSWARMQANQCHANTRWYEQNDPENKSRQVTGWWVQWPDFVLHSVVERDGHLMCITPSHFDEAQIPFIPDPKIVWTESGDVYSAMRDGKIIGPGIRAFPAYTMAKNQIIRDRLLRGVNPYKAGDFTDAEIEKLKNEYT